MASREVYLRIGLYAEGRTDYDFLSPLLNRLLPRLATVLFPGHNLVPDCLGIDAPLPFPTKRADRIAAAIEHSEECTLFVIHSDGEGKPDKARGEQITPGINAARARCAGRPVTVAACIPVREIEAWMLVDPEVFQRIGGKIPPDCPAAPERERDPKVTLKRLLKDSGVRRPRPNYAFFGANVRFECLRKLPAFVSFEQELKDAIMEAAKHQGFQC